MSSEAVLERPGMFSDNVSAVTGLRVSQVLELLYCRMIGATFVTTGYDRLCSGNEAIV